MHAAIIVFPGTNCEKDCQFAIEDGLAARATLVFHKEPALPRGTDLVILPGGFAHGDYLRCGAIAQFSPVMEAIKAFAAGGGLVWGICNGFQVLTECGLLPGALLQNRTLTYLCMDTLVRVERSETPFSRGLAAGTVLKLPIGHGDGAYFIDPKGLAGLESGRQVLFRYVDERGEATDVANPNGSIASIAGITNAAGNVCGMMPHPDRCADALLGNDDGIKLFRAVAVGLAGAAAGR